MQSHLQAALLGRSNLNHSSNAEDEDSTFQEEEQEENEEFDEEIDCDNGPRVGVKHTSNSRTVTLQMLLDANILQPGHGSMTIEYLGQKFVGDLLQDGKIRSQETDIVFASPSAWAIACKRFINPDKKSGCGWASVRYKGKKLDAYKNIWYKKKKEEQEQEQEQEQEICDNEFVELKNMATSVSYSRIVVKHNTIANRTLTHDANTLIECVPFSNLGKIQPFLVSLSTNAALLMDFHSHLTRSEVSGYLAGQWDVNSHNLKVTHAFPCRSTKADRDKASQVESEIAKTIDKEKLLLVGWYHSHPFTAAAPTLRDVDAQLEYQIRMKGQSDNSYTPCIGVIISPYNYENASLESSIIAYWVIPPPEAKPNEYGRPMLMSYSVSQDSQLTDHVRNEITKCCDYYKEKDFVPFREIYLGNSLFIDKLRSTLTSKFPREEKEMVLWKFIRESVGCNIEEAESLLSIPSVSKHQLLPTLNAPVSLNSMMLPQDISSLFYNSMSSTKFTGGTSGILGLPDPMAHSTLAANNMFLQSNLFKMQELLKPLSTSSPVTKTKEPKLPASVLKIPTEVKSWKNEYASPDVLNLKSNFLAPDLNLSKISSDYAYRSPKDYSVTDLSGTKNSVTEFSLDLSKSQNLSDSDKSHMSKSSGFSMLDLSMSKTNDSQQFNEQILNFGQKEAPKVDDNIPLDLAK